MQSAGCRARLRHRQATEPCRAHKYLGGDLFRGDDLVCIDGFTIHLHTGLYRAGYLHVDVRGIIGKCSWCSLSNPASRHEVGEPLEGEYGGYSCDLLILKAKEVIPTSDASLLASLEIAQPRWYGTTASASCDAALLAVDHPRGCRELSERGARRTQPCLKLRTPSGEM